MSSVNLLRDTTEFPKSDSGFKTETVTLSPTFKLDKRFRKSLLSFSKTTASVFAPISTKISDEVNFVIVPCKASPFFGLTKVEVTDLIKSAIDVAFEDLFNFVSTTHLITFLFRF